MRQFELQHSKETRTKILVWVHHFGKQAEAEQTADSINIKPFDNNLDKEWSTISCPTLRYDQDTKRTR